MSTAKLRPSRGYPLIALFLIITACGVVAALIGPAMRAVFDGTVGAQDAAMACAASTVIIMLLGAIIGLFHYHRGRGFLWGTVTGAAVGIFVGPMVIAPRNSLGTMLGLSIGGSLVVILVATAFRFASRAAKQPGS